MGSVTIPASPATVTATFTVPDGGVVSSGGAHVDFGSITAPLDQISVIMTGPDADGNAVDPLTHVHVPGDGIAYGSWAAGAFGTGSGPATVTLFAPDAAGCYIAGVWSVMTRSAAAGGTVTQVILFTEGIGPNQNTGGAIFNWGVYADPAHMGENGYNADLALARQIIQKMAPAHTVGNLIQSLDPHPDVDAGIHAAIPDECLPV
jgi:hypothetical protein